IPGKQSIAVAFEQRSLKIQSWQLIPPDEASNLLFLIRTGIIKIPSCVILQENRNISGLFAAGKLSPSAIGRSGYAKDGATRFDDITIVFAGGARQDLRLKSIARR